MFVVDNLEVFRFYRIISFILFNCYTSFSKYISILLYIENFGHGPSTPFPLYTHFINHDIEQFNALPDTIKTMEKIPHMIIVEITDAQDDGPKPKDFKKELEEEYGSININLEDGTYTPIEKEEDKKE